MSGRAALGLGRGTGVEGFPAWGQLHVLYLGSISSRQRLHRIHQGNPWKFPPTSSPEWKPVALAVTALVFVFGWRLPLDLPAVLGESAAIAQEETFLLGQILFYI